MTTEKIINPHKQTCLQGILNNANLPILYLNHGLTTPYGLSVFAALIHKSLPFELRLINLEQGENKQALYLQQSKTAKVPMLEITRGDAVFYLSESSAIIEYLDERADFKSDADFALSVLPIDIEKRAACRQIQAMIRSDFLAIRHERSMELTFSASAKPALSDEAKQQAAKLSFFASAFLEHSKSAAFLLDEWSIADVDMAIILSRLAFSVDASDYLPQHLIDYTYFNWQHNQGLQAFLKLRVAAGLPTFMPEVSEKLLKNH